MKISRTILGVLLLLASTATPAVLEAQEIKDPNPPQGSGGPLPDDTGGPDAFGYTYADDAEPTCTGGGFVDISATGMQVVVGDDVSSGPVALGGDTFNFYGTDFTSLVMASNGYISTDPTDTGPDLSNDCPLPAPPSTGGGARMYPLHDDLDLEAGFGEGYFQYFATCPRPNDRCQAGEACSIFQWDDVAHFPGGAAAPTWDIQVILYHDTNDFVYIIGAGNPELGSGSTTGIQDFPPPTTALVYACNTAASVPDDTSICWFHPNPVPGTCQEADLALVKTASPTSVAPGDDVVFTLAVTNNGPGDASNVIVTDMLPAEVTYVSDDCAGMNVPPWTWNVGALANGATATCNITVTVNAGVEGTISNTATVTSDSTDPVTANDTGSDSFGVQQSVLEIPTVGGVGLAVLVLLIGVSAALLLRRRRTA